MTARRTLPIALCALLLVALLAAPATAAPTRKGAFQPALALVPERVFRLNAHRIALVHQKVRIVGVTRQYAPHQVLTVRVKLGKRTVIRARRTVQQFGTRGRFAIEFKAHRLGRLRAFATGSGVKAQSRSIDVIGRSAGGGDSGLKVVFLQHRLRALHYLVSFSGSYDDATARAVLAYRKVNRMQRIYSANRTIFERLARKQGSFHARYPNHGRHIEADLSRQVIALFGDDGKLFRVLITSSGKPSTPTVLGSFHVYLKTPGTNSKGMLNSNYFIGGYAIHGYPDVPAYAASHGCLRIPNANAGFMFRWVKIGDRVDVYR